MDEGSFQTIECETAMDFYLALSPNLGCYTSAAPRHLNLYRGLDKASYQLVPSALRGEDSDIWTYGPGYERQIENGGYSAELQLQAEVHALASFFQFADSTGLAIPGDGFELRESFDRLVHVNSFVDRVLAGTEDWPPRFAGSLLALAQHFGIPTRLLDWTRDPYVAAYFAAIKAAEREYFGESHGNAVDDNKIAVWSLKWETIDITSKLGSGFSTGLSFITAPSATNSNLRAQKGLFSKVRLTSDASYITDCRPLDELLLRSKLVTTISKWAWPLRRFTLPSLEASKVLLLLANVGISGATLFPGFDGAAKATKEQRLFANIVDPRQPGISRKMFEYCFGISPQSKTGVGRTTEETLQLNSHNAVGAAIDFPVQFTYGKSEGTVPGAPGSDQTVLDSVKFRSE